MFVTNWISTTKIQKISEITNFFRHYFLSRTEVLLGKNVKFADIAIFSLGLKVKGGAPTKEDFNVAKYILGLKLRARATGELKTENLDTTIKLINLAAPATENPGNPVNPGNPDDIGKDNPSGGGSQTTGGGGSQTEGGGGTTDSGTTDGGGDDNVSL